MNNEVLDFTQALKHFHTNYLNVPHTKCATYTLRTMSWTSLVSILPDAQCNIYYIKHLRHCVNDNGTGQVTVNLFLYWCIKSNAEKRRTGLSVLLWQLSACVLDVYYIALQPFISYKESNLSSHCSLVDSTKTDTDWSSQIDQRQVSFLISSLLYLPHQNNTDMSQ